MEIELQKSYGYKVDRQSYKNLINKNKMKVNATEQTSTFPCSAQDLNELLKDNVGYKWQTPHGEFSITKDTWSWILQNHKTSMYNNNRCYIYNKAFASWFLGDGAKVNIINSSEEAPNVYDLIRQWATEKGIYAKGDSKTQYLKLMEEAGELADSILKRDEPEIKDAIGDMVVVLTNLAALEGLNIEDCVTSAYDVIKSRKGKMVNGTFVKNVAKAYTQNGISKFIEL